MKHFISLKDIGRNALLRLLQAAAAIKNDPDRYTEELKGVCAGLLFEKPSLRTKTSFYLGARKLGADAVYYTPDEVKLGLREDIGDVARTCSRYFDCAILRTYRHGDIIEFARGASVPVVNALSDLLHPSQALGDLQTIIEVKKKEIGEVRICYVGDGNNVCHSLLYAVALLGGNLSLATPKEYAPQTSILNEARAIAGDSGASIVQRNDPQAAVEGADIIYTDVWTSMGRESERTARKKDFKNFQINDKLLRGANNDCSVMHCLPAHRGEEITDGVIDGKRSIVFDQAENRLYSAQAILLYVLEKL